MAMVERSTGEQNTKKPSPNELAKALIEELTRKRPDAKQERRKHER